MSDFYLAPSLVKLRDEINRKWPKRDKASDGWVGDTSHQARVSDHNPDWAAGGVVRAIDVDIDGIDRLALLRTVIGDPRVWYVISNRIIYSRTYGWAARSYTGSNPHDKHVHISIMHTRAAENDASTWFAAKPPRDKGHRLVSLRNVRAQARKPSKALLGVARVQRALNERYRLQLDDDGWWGDKTRAAYRKHEASMRAQVVNGIPDAKTLRNLARGRFKVVDVKGR